MTPRAVRLLGLAGCGIYGSFIIWVYAQQPQTVAQVTGGVASTLGLYTIDEAGFAEGLRFFRADQFPEARAAFGRADPARRDPKTQFYVAYSYYRQGWGRLYHDDRLYQEGLTAINQAIAVAPGGHIIMDDANLGMRTADEVKAELERGLTHDASDFNPLKVFRPRK